MTTTRKGDTHELLLLLQLLSFNIKNTARNRNKRTLLQKKQVQCEKTWLWEWISKDWILCFKTKTKCWLLKTPTVSQYWIKLTNIFENMCLPSQQKNGQKHLYRPIGTASINIDPRSTQANLPKLLPTRLAQTRVLKQYNMKDTK